MNLAPNIGLAESFFKKKTASGRLHRRRRTTTTTTPTSSALRVVPPHPVTPTGRATRRAAARTWTSRISSRRGGITNRPRHSQALGRSPRRTRCSRRTLDPPPRRRQRDAGRGGCVNGLGDGLGRRRCCCAISEGPLSAILPGRAAQTTRCGAPGLQLRSCQRCRRGTCTRSTATRRSWRPRRWRSSCPPASIVGWGRRPCTAPSPACRWVPRAEPIDRRVARGADVAVVRGASTCGGRVPGDRGQARSVGVPCGSVTVWHRGIRIASTTRRARRSLMRRGVIVGAGAMRLLNCA